MTLTISQIRRHLSMLRCELRNGLYNIYMTGILQFAIRYEDGGYTANAVNAPIATSGQSFEELQRNIAEAVAVFLKDEELLQLGFIRTPSVLANFELPIVAYGEKA